jgi:hypothetical protein
MFIVPYNGDTFLDPQTNTGINFTVGSDGRATSVRFTRFDLPGRNGTFVRISP